jgi:hypothetical protein
LLRELKGVKMELNKITLDKMRKTLDRKLAIFMALNPNSTKSMRELVDKSDDFSDEEYQFIFKESRQGLLNKAKKLDYEIV